MGTRVRHISATLCAACIATGIAGAALGHPHAFIDGGVDFVMDADGRLQELAVTWHYDPFETLYTLSAFEIPLNAEGGLDEADRLELVRRLGEWPEDFDGSAHLSVDDVAVSLQWPEGVDAHLVDGRILMTFTRSLEIPLEVRGRDVEVGFYESTYFFDFTVTLSPEVRGADGQCAARVIPFELDQQLARFQTMLLALDREETPETENVGALFADWIVLSCE